MGISISISLLGTAQVTNGLGNAIQTAEGRFHMRIIEDFLPSWHSAPKNVGVSNSSDYSDYRILCSQRSTDFSGGIGTCCFLKNRPQTWSCRRRRQTSAFRFLMGEQPTLAFSNSSNHQATGFFLQEGTHGELMGNRSRCHLWCLWCTPGDVIAGVRDQLPESQESDSDRLQMVIICQKYRFPLWVGSMLVLPGRLERRKTARKTQIIYCFEVQDPGDPFRRDAIDANSVSNRIPIPFTDPKPQDVQNIAKLSCW